MACFLPVTGKLVLPVNHPGYLLTVNWSYHFGRLDEALLLVLAAISVLLIALSRYLACLPATGWNLVFLCQLVLPLWCARDDHFVKRSDHFAPEHLSLLVHSVTVTELAGMGCKPI